MQPNGRKCVCVWQWASVCWCVCVTNEMRPQRKNKRAGKHFGPAIICANILQEPKRDEPETIEGKVERCGKPEVASLECLNEILFQYLKGA